MVSNFKFLKQLDAFKQPVKLFLGRKDRKTNKIVNYERLGTYFGFILTLIAAILTLLYFLFMWINMFGNHKDYMQYL